MHCGFPAGSRLHIYPRAKNGRRLAEVDSLNKEERTYDSRNSRRCRGHSQCSDIRGPGICIGVFQQNPGSICIRMLEAKELAEGFFFWRGAGELTAAEVVSTTYSIPRDRALGILGPTLGLPSRVTIARGTRC